MQESFISLVFLYLIIKTKCDTILPVMETLVLKPNKKSIDLACKLLRDGEVVGVPTETVYGLAGDAKNPIAIKKIFEAKGRPNDNPLIVHISKLSMLKDVVSSVPLDAKKLAKAFWPGPLTIIMPRGSKVCDETCAGLDSVGVRMPSNKIARKIISKSGIFFSAPSANLSGKPSPTTAQDVFADMNGRVPLIIDGGECKAGVESTVVSVLGPTPIILRPGYITKDDMEKVLHKEVKIAAAVTEGVSKDEKVLSPGMKYKHYSPNAEIVIVKGSFEKYKKYVQDNYKQGVYALCFDEDVKALDCPALSYGKEKDAASQAHNLFNKLRELDTLGAKKVFARCPDIDGIGLAVYNRLIRAAGFNIIQL